jgi:hypothetical protein
MSLPRKISAGVLAAVMIASLTALSSSIDASADPKGLEGAGERAVAHHADGKVIAANNRGPTPRYFDLGLTAGEPTIGTTNEGNVFYVALAGLGPTIMRTGNDGAKWTDVSPKLPNGQNVHRVSLDPYIYVDETEGVDRIFTIDLTVACSYMSFSDDEGETWLTNPLACGKPVNDHQTLFSGPPATSITIDYPNVVYYCWNDIATSSCSKSIDGGLTFRPTGFPAYPGVRTEDFEQCGGLHGHGHVGPEGNVYLPRDYCGQPWIAITKDEGTTWTNVQVAKNGAPPGSDPSVATDRNGNVYYLYTAKNRLPYLVVSRDEGATWSKPLMVGAPGVTEANLVTLDSSASPGKIAFSYYGSENSPFPRCKMKCETKDYEKVTWNAYMATSVTALDDDPVFYSTTVNDKSDPMKRRFCGFPPGNQGSNRCDTSVYDFIDIQIAPDGGVWGAYVDACRMVCVGKKGLQDDGNQAIVGSLVGGPGLL